LRQPVIPSEHLVAICSDLQVGPQSAPSLVDLHLVHNLQAPRVYSPTKLKKVLITPSPVQPFLVVRVSPLGLAGEGFFTSLTTTALRIPTLFLRESPFLPMTSKSQQDLLSTLRTTVQNLIARFH